MTQECWNKHKLNILCKLGNSLYKTAKESQYSIELCDHDNLVLASALYEAICPIVFDDNEESVCLTEDDANSILIYIYNLLKNCNCNGS